MIWDYWESENKEFGTNDDSNNAGCQNISVIKNWHKNHHQIAAVVILNYSISKHKKKRNTNHLKKTTNSVKLVQLTTQQLKAASALSMTRKIAMKHKWWCRLYSCITFKYIIKLYIIYLCIKSDWLLWKTLTCIGVYN